MLFTPEKRTGWNTEKSKMHLTSSLLQQPNRYTAITKAWENKSILCLFFLNPVIPYHGSPKSLTFGGKILSLGFSYAREVKTSWQVITTK